MYKKKTHNLKVLINKIKCQPYTKEVESRVVYTQAEIKSAKVILDRIAKRSSQILSIKLAPIASIDV